MKKLNCFIIAGLLATQAGFAKITLQESKPLAGKEITVSCSESLSRAPLTVYVYNSKTAVPQILEQIANIGSTKITLPEDAEYAVVKNFLPNGTTESLGITLYTNSGNPVRNTLYYQSLYDVGGLEGSGDVIPDNALALQDIQTELANYPDNRLAKMTFYAVQYDQKQADKTAIIKEIEKFPNDKGDWNEAEINALVKLYSSLEYDTQADSLTKFFSQKYPSGSLAEQTFLETLNRKEGDEYISLSEIFLRQFPNSNNKSVINERSVQYYVSKGEYAKAENLLRNQDFMPPTQALYLAFIYLEKQKSREKAENLLAEVAATLRSQIGKSNDKTISNYEWDMQVKSHLAETYRATGEFYMQLKEKDLALSNLMKAKETFSVVPAKLYENLTIANYIFRNDSLAFLASEEAILHSVISTKVLDINSKLFSKQDISQPYNIYIENLKAKAAELRQAEIRNKLVRRDIKLPILPNADGLQIDLGIFKGDIIVIDMFASWCQPCESGLASLVAMSKVQNIGKTQLLGVSCRENGTVDKTQYQSEDFGAVKIFFDEDNAFAKSLGIQGLPTRLFFDRAGNLRYIMKGAIGKDEDIRETQDVISVLNNG